MRAKDLKHGKHGADLRERPLKALELLRRLGAATNEWQRRQVEGGFTVNQALVLHRLASHGDATPSQLASWMQVTRGSVSPTIKRLEDLGLVKRRVDAEDARKQWLTATPEARRIAPQVDATILHPLFSEFRSWDAEGLRAFVKGMERLLESPAFGGRA